MDNVQVGFFNFLDMALRVPSLFVMDEVFKYSCGFSPLLNSKLSQRYSSLVYNENPLLGDVDNVLTLDSSKKQEDEKFWNYQDNFTEDIVPHTDLNEINKYAFIPMVGKVLCCFIALFVAQVIFLLSWPKLVRVYKFIFCLMLIVFSYQTNMTTSKILLTMEDASHPSLLQSFLALNTTALWNSSGKAFCIASNYLFQAGIGLLFATLTPMVKHSAMRGVIIISFLFPTLTHLLPVPTPFTNSLPVFTALLPLGILKYIVIRNIYAFVAHLVSGYRYAKMIAQNYGLHSLLETEWGRLNVPNVLRTFWLLRTAQHISVLLGNFMYLKGEVKSIFFIQAPDLFWMFREVMIYGCETTIALLGMTSIVSYIGYYIGLALQVVLMSEDDTERSMGTVCAVLFFVLAEQSGLTVLEGNKRFIRLCRNFTFLFTAMLHFTHNMVNPVLMSLSASRNPVTHRHARALAVSFLLIFMPCSLIYLLWNRFTLSTWLLAVSAFSVQVVVKTLVSLLIYSLFLIDAYRNNFWESLDDYVYYIRAFGNSVEFVFGILLFFTGAWIYFFESGGSIRATMICIHAYFNIWCEAKNGWVVFIKRRTAVQKINSLPEATKEQLDKHSDVCAICFQDLLSAKITKCNHFFHSVCLRKWLYVQDSCPLCHKTLYKVENIQENVETNVPNVEMNPHHLDDNIREDIHETAASPESVVDTDIRWQNVEEVESEEELSAQISKTENDVNDSGLAVTVNLPSSVVLNDESVRLRNSLLKES